MFLLRTTWILNPLALHEIEVDWHNSHNGPLKNDSLDGFLDGMSNFSLGYMINNTLDDSIDGCLN